MKYKYMLEEHDYSQIDKLNKLNDVNTFWDNVRKLIFRVTSDYSIKR